MKRLEKYPKYKRSNVLWIGDVPLHWDFSRLKWSVVDCRNGAWGDEAQGDLNDTYVVRVADFDRHRFYVAAENFTVRNIPSAERRPRLLKPRDLLLEKSGGGDKQLVGAVALYCSDAAPTICANFIAKMTPASGYDARYLTYLHASLYSARVVSRSIKQTTGIQNIDSEAYLGEVVAFPPSQEQRQIAAFLDYETARIDRLIEKQQRLIELLQEKRQAVISQAVTKGLDRDAPMKDSGVEWLGAIPEHWEVKKLSLLTSKITNGYVGPTRDVLTESGIRYLQSLHIKDNEIHFDHPYFVSKEWSDGHAKSILSEGDVLVVQTGDIGQVAYVPHSFAGANCHALIILSPRRNSLSGKYLAWTLRSSYGFGSLKSIQTGALHPHLNCGYVREIVLPLPPLDEQEQIVSELERRLAVYQGLVARATAANGYLEEHRTALISAAVTGKIDVRDWQPPQSANDAEERDEQLLQAAEERASYD